MRAEEFTQLPKNRLKTYSARIKVQQTGYDSIIDATVQARNPEMARRLFRQLYGGRSQMIGQPRLLK